MAFKLRAGGRAKTMWLPIAGSVAIPRGSIVEFTSGTIVAGDSGTLPGEAVGVLDRTIAATDSDYAVARLVPVLVPTEKGVVWECNDVDGTFTAADVGVEVDLTDAVAVNVDASSIKIAKCVGFGSATSSLFQLKIGGSY